MFDPNNEPNYSPGMNDYAPQGQNYDYGGPQMPQIDIKKYLPIIVGIIVLLAVGFFILSWLGSQKEVSIKLVDIDGNPISAAGSLTLKDDSGRAVDLTTKGKAKSFTATLFPGTYTAKVIAEDYESFEDTITIKSGDSSDNTIELKLTKNINASLAVALDATKIYEGQEIGGRINVINNGNEFNVSDITATSTSPVEVKITNPNFSTISPGVPVNIDFTVSIKSGATVTKATPVSIIFKIKGSTVKSDKFDLTAMPAVKNTQLTMTATGGDLSKTIKLTAGKQMEYNLKFKNANTTVPIDDLRITIVPDSGYEDALDWITITDSDSPSEKVITTIDPTKDQIVKVFVKAPLSASKGTQFVGKITATSDSLKGEWNYQISFIVDVETKVNLTFKTKDEFLISCNKTTGTCSGATTLATGEAYFENNGNIDIGTITISVNLEAQETTANCPSYLRLNTAYIKDGLKVGEKYDISMNILNPLESGDNATEVCILHWEYNNPLDPTIREYDEMPIKIVKKTT